MTSPQTLKHEVERPAQYLSPRLMSAGPAAGAAEGGEHCSDPCLSALTEEGKRDQIRALFQRGNYIYSLLRIHSNDLCQGFKKEATTCNDWIQSHVFHSQY